MIYKVVRDSTEIDNLVSDCCEAEDKGSRFPGMSYEDGIKYAIEWLTDKGAPHPLEN